MLTFKQRHRLVKGCEGKTGDGISSIGSIGSVGSVGSDSNGADRHVESDDAIEPKKEM